MGIQEQFAAEAIPVLDDALALASARPRSLYPALKRMLDLAASVALLIAVLPLLLAIAFWIRLDSGGPVFFRQTRLGKDGRPFRILKFRTMTVLEDGDCVVQAARGDARITRAGRFLRASSLDELPQLLNVIRGEMSLVGPRPHAEAHDRHYGALIAGYDRRQSVKPGITGWAQIKGCRGGTPTLDLMRQRVEHDLWYARHASLRLDLRILAQTPFALLFGRNAY